MHSRRELARALSAVSDFDQPIASLEQYLTSPELASHVCHVAEMAGDVSDRTVVDLGTGTGMLAIGARFGGPDRIVGIDVDAGALSTAVENERRIFADRSIEWIRADATRPPLSISGVTVFSNPPFGAQNASSHADRAFLVAIADIASVSYTIHNEGSRSFVESFADDVGASLTHAFAAEIPVGRRFDFHTEDRRDLPVEVYRIEW
ncbi:METTL5 family protein [Halovivax gelatinilyticus]|uniref:METTL5 family protein n=1 Tax=Halovivax gelatinilyticus TaxID=2961597 RepID=UPI0020CA51CB|nr:METTL5 family protein [Halovivax gelatinilyticus]